VIGNIEINDSKITEQFLSRRAVRAGLSILMSMIWMALAGATQSWAQGSSSQVLTIAIDASNPNTVYASTVAQGVFKTTNGGATWASANSGIVADTSSLSIHPTTPTTLYAASVNLTTLTPGGVFKTTNGGTSWSESGLLNQYTTSVKIDTTTPSTVYAGAIEVLALGSPGGVFRTTNGGIFWFPINDGLTNQQVWCLAMNPVTTTILYAGTEGGVFKKTSAEAAWTAMNTGLTHTQVFTLAINPSNPLILYAGTRDGFVFKTVDGGANWAPSDNGLPTSLPGGLVIGNIAVDPLNPTTLFVGTNAGLFKSTDSGGTWTLSNNGISIQYVSAVAVDPTNSSKVYAGTYGAGVYKSLDGGATWTQTNLGIKQRRAQTISQ